jgi:hypothetical protein
MSKYISSDPTKYRYWDILEELPEGWVIDKVTGAPGIRTVFITNGKSVFNGQKRALLRLPVEQEISISINNKE